MPTPTDNPSQAKAQSIGLKGLPVSPGIVIGRALVLDDDYHKVARRLIPESAVAAEVARADKAIQASISELMQVYQTARREMGEEAAKIFMVHVAMLSDKRTLVGPIHTLIEHDWVTAEYAVSHVLQQLAEKFRHSADSAFVTKSTDIEDLAHRLVGHLVGKRESRLAAASDQSIVFARDLTPSQTAGLDRGKILGFVTDLGGKTGHTAIVAHALGIPAVVGCHGAMQQATEGVAVILDGERGDVILDPSPEQIEHYRVRIEQRKLFTISLSDLNDLPSQTTDGVHIELVANIEFPEQCKQVLEHGGEGVGLYRTEYLYLMGNPDPSERDHFQAYKKAVDLLKGKPLTIRTVDLGADKLRTRDEEENERNPFLGNRSIRLCLRDQPMFKRQLRAILRASALGPIKIMFPLVSSMSELRKARYLLHETMEDLADDSIAFDKNVKVGMMVEVPSAAVMADVFAREVDFFSIGTNDLVQYTLAVDRSNEKIADLYTPFHPGVIRLIKETVRGAKTTSIPVSCCGESAADIEFALLLLGLGLRTLSVTSSSIPQLKRLVRSVSVQQCERVAEEALSLDSDSRVASFLRDQARKIIPEAYGGRSGD